MMYLPGTAALVRDFTSRVSSVDSEQHPPRPRDAEAATAQLLRPLPARLLYGRPGAWLQLLRREHAQQCCVNDARLLSWRACPDTTP
jgi:hypothetical protein